MALLVRDGLRGTGCGSYKLRVVADLKASCGQDCGDATYSTDYLQFKCLGWWPIESL